VKGSLFPLLAIGLILLAFIACLYFFQRDSTGSFYPQTVNQSSYSVSAVGLALFYELLADNHQLHRALRGVNWRPEPNQLVVLSQIDLSLNQVKSLAQAPRLLLILPKYNYQVDASNPSWIMSAKTKLDQKLGPIYQQLGLSATETSLVNPPQKWSTTLDGVNPTLIGTARLIQDPLLTPLIAAPEGILLGEIHNEKQRILLLTDPDIVNNHGLGQGDNLALALAMINRISPAKSEIIFDEPLVAPKNARNERASSSKLFEFPTGPQTLLYILILANVLVALLSLGSRFGPPRKDAGTDGETVEYGRRKLIENSAQLLRKTKSQQAVTLNYLALIIKMAAKAARLPKGLAESETRQRLEKLDPQFSLAQLFREIDQTPHPSPNLRLEWAIRAHDWKARLERGFKTGRRHN
jgi:hypothetical protein